MSKFTTQVLEPVLQISCGLKVLLGSNFVSSAIDEKHNISEQHKIIYQQCLNQNILPYNVRKLGQKSQFATKPLTNLNQMENGEGVSKIRLPNICRANTYICRLSFTAFKSDS